MEAGTNGWSGASALTTHQSNADQSSDVTGAVTVEEGGSIGKVQRAGSAGRFSGQVQRAGDGVIGAMYGGRHSANMSMPDSCGKRIFHSLLDLPATPSCSDPVALPKPKIP